MYNYYDNIYELESKAGILANDIFDYQYSPISEIYAKYFLFCQENLTEECDEYQIQPAKFYYRTSFSVNARAGRQNGYFIVGVNMGTIQSLYNLFYEQNDIFEDDEYISSLYRELIQKFDVPVGHLMFQIGSLFTYYHELAHLIQNPFINSQWLVEQYSDFEESGFSIERHALELDADLNAAHSICFHLLEYFNGLDIESKTEENLQKILSIGVASIFSYFLLYFKESVDIYYEKYSHPHPLVRISYIVDCFIKVAEHNLPNNFNLDANAALREGFIMSEIFFQRVMNVDLVKEFSKHFLNESSNIESYVNKILDIADNMPNLLKNRKANTSE